MDKKRLKNDIILIAALLCLALICFGAVNLTQKGGAYASVSVNGNEIARYPLDTDLETTISTEGGHINILVIKDGKAEIIEADCPDKLCVKHKPVSMTGETIVCLPHKLVVKIVGGEGDRG